MREVSGHELVATYDDPWVRHQTDPEAVVRAYVDGPAAVVSVRNRLPGGSGTMAVALGPTDALDRLFGEVAAIAPAPGRLILPSAALGVVPDAWRPDPVREWHWMLTTTVPDEPAEALVEVTEAPDIDALLDAHQPDAHSRPGSPNVEVWLGIRDDGRLVAVGALRRHPDGTGNLGAITVDAEVRGGGLGTALSAGLTRRALDGPSATATLGVYTDNAPAIAIYRKLGYEVVHTFVAGPVSDRSSTTAVAPSR